MAPDTARDAGPDLTLLTEALLDAARTAGADAADAIAVQGESLSVGVRDGALEQAERSEVVDIGLRVLIGQRQACVSSSDIRPDTIAAMAERAVAMAREAPEDPWCGLAEPEEIALEWDAEGLDLIDHVHLPGPEDLRAAALTAEAAARAVPGVSRMDSAGASWGASRFHLAASNGFSGGYGRTHHGIEAVAIQGEGLAMERDYAYDSRTHFTDMEDPETIGRRAGERAVARGGARKPPTGAFPVVFDERVAQTLIGHLVQAANGASVARGSSWLRDAMDTPVLPEAFDLIEDPHRPRVAGSRPFDAEGILARRRAIVAGGALRSWTLDLATARQLGLATTGNASRGTSAPPSPGLSNLALTQGTASRDELIAAMGTGLIVTSLIGASINPTTGDYSRGAGGFWVEKGEIVHPVNECTIAGNLREMLGSIVAANDARTHLSRVVPSLLLEGIVIAGD
ncbi:TldD/PmbA family protein [Amaricoccus solimangrovi]|uniref:TldD/PmbA family protein n=1 Tax=Amaricoccus solimangrovi TaxID=2589815 RepID=A0A501WRU3_9RHOB|nr:TldD/PmbA family protein [Amaricoccus solimangrovi]TPE52088.1 TldD/PmbA family protein [Amaricoccus solimangrovi]